jgi:hypothetical protein
MVLSYIDLGRLSNTTVNVRRTKRNSAIEVKSRIIRKNQRIKQGQSQCDWLENDAENKAKSDIDIKDCASWPKKNWIFMEVSYCCTKALRQGRTNE